MNQILSLQKSKRLRRLEALRANPKLSLNAQFRYQEKLSETPGPELQNIWFREMRSVLQELDQYLRIIPDFCPFRFLDLGCCPGGFSSYILGKNGNASGVGISLSVEDGGHPYLLEEKFRPRLELRLADFTTLQLGFDTTLHPFPFHFYGQTFDLVLLDGHALRTATSATARNGACLLISQLIICLQTIAVSGTIVMKLSRPENLVTAKMLYLLDALSLSLHTWKPVYIHATRPTFYAVAKGVGYGRQGHRLPEFLYCLKLLWLQLMDSPYKSLEPEDLDFIVTDDALEATYSKRLKQLSGHIWMVQEESLTGWSKTFA